MDKRELEQRLAAHLEQDSLILTPINVGFTFGIDTKDAAALMAALAEDGKLERTGGANLDAIYRMPGRPFAGTPPGGPSVAKPRSSAAIYHALSNLLIPGLGSLIYLKPAGFVPVLVLIAAAVLMIVFFSGWGMTVALLPLFFAWLWSVVYGAILYARDPWHTKNGQ